MIQKQRLCPRGFSYRNRGRKYQGYVCDESFMCVTLCKFSVEKCYFDGNIPYETFKTWNSKCGDQIKTNCTIFLTTENPISMPVVSLIFK